MDVKKIMTNIIYLIGKSGSGKYTIAKELAKQGYIICDNQLINYPIFSLLNYDGFTTIPQFAWKIIAQIRDSIFTFLSQEIINNYVLTNVLGDIEQDYKMFKQVEEMASNRNSLFVPVKLLISIEENIKRIQNKERLLRYKSIDPEDVHKQNLINISHPKLLQIDVSNKSASEVANEILIKIKSANEPL